MVISTVVPLAASSGGVVFSGAAYWLARTYGYGVRYWCTSGKYARRAHRDAAYVRRSHKQLFYEIGLYLKVKPRARAADGNARPPKIKYPKLKKITSDDYGILAEWELVPKVRLKDFQEASEDFANYWNMVRVTALQPEPNRVQVRAVRRDPLVTKTVSVFPEQPKTLRYYPVGVDDFGMSADIRLHHSSGIGVFGMPNYGKTSMLLSLISYLAPSDSVVFLIADGKTATGYEGDYMDVAPRALSVIGDDPLTFNQWIHQIENIRRMRASMIRHALGVRNFWDHGPTPEWPILMPIIDECHSYFEQTPSAGHQGLQQRNAVVADNAHTTSELVRKCQSVGIIPVLATQKGVGEAVPTMIRDNLTTRICFAVSTDEAAQAALGSGIRSHPEASPLLYQHEDYVGVATMMSGKVGGYVRVRTPFTRDQVAKGICERYAHLVRPEVCPGLEIGTTHRRALTMDDELDFTIEFDKERSE